MTTEEKAAHFDNLAAALIHQWTDSKKWSWWCLSPPGGPMRDTPGEAVADLLAWAERVAKKNRPRVEVTLANPGERRDGDAGKIDAVVS